jgi:hypothetical protein
MSLPFPNRCQAVHEVAPERGRRLSDSADPSRPLADAVRAMLADAARRQRGPK